MRFVIPLPPSKNDSHVERAVAKRGELEAAVRSGNWHAIKRAMKVIRHRSPAYKAYVVEAEEIARAQNVQPLSGDVILSVTAFFPDRRRDMANIVDVLLDSLEGIAYHNDRQVVAFGRWSREIDAEDPRCVVTVEALEPGLFDVDTDLPLRGTLPLSGMWDDALAIRKDTRGF